MHARHFAPLLAICLSLTACGGEKEPKASDSPPPTQQEIAYHDCLKKHGVDIVYRGNGMPYENKDQPWNEEAHTACASLHPAPHSPEPADPDVLAAAQKQAECMRAEGISWYPDPDPVTAEFDQSKGGTPEQWSSLKTEHLDTLRKCRPAR
ncbi:hypothetical protein AB0B01_16590 [Streptomyces sp. NPDC044571]|uniref:hypothetical protein n=1 Tax=Streptomyces sp. NPDC044571 TaxID=3155371 RepID=UPI0033E9389A